MLIMHSNPKVTVKSPTKPPLPPKPKILPKPKHIPRPSNLQINTKRKVRPWPVNNSFFYESLERSSEQSSSSAPSSGDSVGKTQVTITITDGSPSGQNYYVSRFSESDSGPEAAPTTTLESPSVDTCSRLMEKTLESFSNGDGSEASSECSISSIDSEGADVFIPDDATASIKSDDSITECNNNKKEDNSKKLFYVAQEIYTSEESFVSILKLLNHNFRTFLNDQGCVAKSTEILEHPEAIPEKVLDEILKYLPHIQSLNEQILADFQLRIENWKTREKIADIIVKKGPFLKLYATYIQELEGHSTLLRESALKYSLFGECLSSFENSEASRFLPVGKHMLTPMQRITKYKELMRQYLRRLDPSHEDHPDAVAALEIVEGVARHANEAIRQLEKAARLVTLQERLNGAWEGATTTTATATGAALPLQHVLVEPGRRLLKEGQLMKLCRRGIRVVYLILLSDCLLYTTEEAGGAGGPLRLRHRLPLEGMRLRIPVSDDFQRELTVISTARSFTVRAGNAQERDAWLCSLRSAVEANASRRFSFERADNTFADVSPDTLGKQAPAWVPDDRVTMCQSCAAEFSLTFRRHHCRACGKVVCRYCSSNRAPLEYLHDRSARVCDFCFEELRGMLHTLWQQQEDIVDVEQKKNCSRKMTDLKARFKKGHGDERRARLKKPERLMEVCGGDSASQICGYLRHWQRRSWRLGWFVLKGKVLYEYAAPEDVCALSSKPILGYNVNTNFKNVDMFENCMDLSNAFQLEHPNQSPMLYWAESEELSQKWRKIMEKEVLL